MPEWRRRNVLIAYGRDKVTAYGFPFEIYHSSKYGSNVPPYWVRQKVGSFPGYSGMMAMIPEMKTGSHSSFACFVGGSAHIAVHSSSSPSAFLLQSNSFVPSSFDAIATLITSMEAALWELQPAPSNPGNLTAFAGLYAASLLGYLSVGFACHLCASFADELYPLVAVQHDHRPGLGHSGRSPIQAQHHLDPTW